MKLDRTRHFGATFGEDAGQMPYFQDNVYFNVNGDVVDCWYNRENSPHLFGMTPSVDPTPPAAPTPPADPGTPDPTKAASLEGKTDAEVYSASIKLRAMLDDARDPDTFIPDPADREANTAFILRHWS